MNMIKRWLRYTGAYEHENLTVGKVYETHRIEFSTYRDYYLDMTGKNEYYGWNKGTYFIMDDNNERRNVYITGTTFRECFDVVKEERLDYCTNPDPMFKPLIESGGK